jgi:hypothetical protein
MTTRKPAPDACGLCGQSWWCCGETMCPQPRQPRPRRRATRAPAIPTAALPWTAQAFPELQPERQAALNAFYQSLMPATAQPWPPLCREDVASMVYRIEPMQNAARKSVLERLK